ncbi:single-stranded DNA-binding protein [Promicromonospora sp. Populi]|uniref:single-stranded DNA-binding protein n=1 Tax=Promicromonospora sp. Populi TaxID=3239420 RepID=UPI0034E2DC21
MPGNTPVLHMSNGNAWTTFRVASTRRRRTDNGDWTDGPTLWFTVKAWRAAALNVVDSVHKGCPVVVSGRLEVDEWTGPKGEQRLGLVVNASAVGVDATRGRVTFARVVHHDTVPDGAPVADGAPVDPGELVPVPAGEADPFGLDALASAGMGADASGVDGGAGGDLDDEGDHTGVGPRELVTA